MVVCPNQAGAKHLIIYNFQPPYKLLLWHYYILNRKYSVSVWNQYVQNCHTQTITLKSGRLLAICFLSPKK